MTNYKEHLKHITTFIFDYDGVLTDGNVILMETGEALRMANVKDGYALQLAGKKGFRVIIISGGRSKTMTNRFRSLGINDVFIGVDNKKKLFLEFAGKHKIDLKNVLYMGDDIPDYELMLEVGLPTCPADACSEIKSISKYISDFKGGAGCVRDIIEQTLKVQGKWMNHDGFAW